MSKLNKTKVELGDCKVLLKNSKSIVDLVYLDPPFFTKRDLSETTRKGNKKYSFSDKWIDSNEYIEFMHERIELLHKALKDNGSIFIHCDRKSVHFLRIISDKIFGEENFRSEIIWQYKRWSNSSNSLLPAHQNILYYTKSDAFTFNKIYKDYAPTTNIDQILQKRTRDNRNKSIYAKSADGKVTLSDEKKGVPLSDVWEIPFLNPKSKERVNYPTQKPLQLLNQIIRLASNEGDLVLDPFCGSGTTLVSAELNNRIGWGIDISKDAVEVSKQRLKNPIESKSLLLEKGRNSYLNANTNLETYLKEIQYTPIQRNKNLDAILKEKVNGNFVFVLIQKVSTEYENELVNFDKAITKKGGGLGLFISNTTTKLDETIKLTNNISVISTPVVSINALIKSAPKGQKKLFK